MAKVTSLWTIEKLRQFDTRLDVYIDGQGHESIMKWIPPFRACRALNSTAATATPSGTIGDWFHPEDIGSGWVLNTDYEVATMGGFWADYYLSSCPNATRTAVGSLGVGHSLVSQPGVMSQHTQAIAYFKTNLASRFATGGFAGAVGAASWAGKGGLMTDQHWFECWIWSRINRLLLKGNTNGYNTGSPGTPRWHGNVNEIGIADGSGGTSGTKNIAGGGPKDWEVVLDSFCGNLWEFTDGLRLFDGQVYSAGKTINPAGNYADAAYTATGVTISGVTSGNSIAAYRTEPAVARHGIAASTTTIGGGGFDGGGFWFAGTGERISLRGGLCGSGVQCPGALYLNTEPSSASWHIGGRAVLVP